MRGFELIWKGHLAKYLRHNIIVSETKYGVPFLFYFRLECKKMGRVLYFRCI